MINKTLYLFIDESGNFDFSKSGTKYFILTSLLTNNPAKVATPLLKLRYKLLSQSYFGAFEENGYFHASEDMQVVRNEVFKCIVNYKRNLKIDYIATRKKRFDSKLYEKTGKKLLKKIFTRDITQKYSNICIIFSSLFDQKRRGILKQILKSTIKKLFNGSYFLYFHNSKFDYCNQAVDYYGWAIYRKWENNDERSYNLVKKMVNKGPL